MITVYKVLSRFYNKFTSVIRERNKDISIDYDTRNKTTILPKIKNSKIFVFNTLKNAKYFSQSGEYIFEAETEQVFVPKYRSSLTTIERFWEEFESLDITAPYVYTDFPQGCLVCDNLVITKLIEGPVKK